MRIVNAVGGPRKRTRKIDRRRGSMTVVASITLVAIFAFVAIAVDSGRLTLTRTEMQNAVDAAALAASQEITGAVFNAGQAVTTVEIDAASIAVQSARDMAERVATANGVYIDPDRDVYFGKRSFDETTRTWPIVWDEEPYNVVKVVARKDNIDTSAPDGKLPLSFGWALGIDHVSVVTSATAFVEARDIIMVLDFSASMNDDSSMKSFNSLGQSNVEASLDLMWDSLVEANPTFPDTQRAKFPATGFGNVNSYNGTYVSSSSTTSIFNSLGLGQLGSDGRPLYPYPQAGRYSSGTLKNEPTANTSEQLWRDYIYYAKNKSGSYRKRYGYRTLMEYMQEQKYKSIYSEDLWRTPHYPFHGIKQGATMFLDFLTDLDFGDEVGLVSYGGYSQVELTLDDGDAAVDVTNNPITNDYAAIDTIQRHKQAGHYDGWTGMGYGIKDAKEMLIGDFHDSSNNGYLRYGARPTMLIMTDGQTNQGPSGFSLPGGWDWDEWTDYDGNGHANYSTNDSKKKYAFWEATEAIRRGVTVHTMSIGSGADRDLMQAIAFAGRGVWIDVPGGSSVEEMEDQILAAFTQIAASVPPAKLIYNDDEMVIDEDSSDSTETGDGTTYGTGDSGSNSNNGNGNGNNGNGNGNTNSEGDSTGGTNGNNGVGNGEDPPPPGNPPVNDGAGTGPGNPGNQGGANSGSGSSGSGNTGNGNSGGSSTNGNNGVGNGTDPPPPGNPPVNDGAGTGPGNPGNQGGANSGSGSSGNSNTGNSNTGGSSTNGNNGVGNGTDPPPPGNPPVNDGAGTGPGNPGNQGGANSGSGSSGNNSGNSNSGNSNSGNSNSGNNNSGNNNSGNNNSGNSSGNANGNSNNNNNGNSNGNNNRRRRRR